MKLNRRQFLANSAAAGFALSAAPLWGASRIEKYRTALIGSGWWGMNILREAAAAKRSKIVALCDADADTLETAADQVNDLSGDNPKQYRDFRELLEKEKPEIVIVATPDHWHALTTIAAIESGAHVYVEKPTGHTVNESKAMYAVARQSDSVVQVGLHRRIGPHHVSGMRFLKEGGAGEIGMVRMFAHSQGGDEKPSPNSEPPAGMDWDLYCGPAPLRPFNSRIHPGGWRNFLDFANGTLGDWGVHWLDQVLWWTDEKYPETIFSSGGRPIRGAPVLNEREQTTDAPDAQVAVYQFKSFTATWEHRKFAGNSAEKARIGCYFYGTKGTFHMGWRDGWTFYPARDRDEPVHQDSQLQEPDGHNIQLMWQDFLKAIESRRRPVADIEIGHRATTLSLLGMLSMKLGRSIRWDERTETIVGDNEASRLLSRDYRGSWKYPAA